MVDGKGDINELVFLFQCANVLFSMALLRAEVAVLSQWRTNVEELLEKYIAKD
jgi:hypothetical protein